MSEKLKLVDDFSSKKLYPDLKLISHFIRNTSDLNLKNLLRICRDLL